VNQDETDGLGLDGGWIASAEAWIKNEDGPGDSNRLLLLDPVMLRACGDVAGKRVLDLGCGEGRFCRMLAARGAKVVGLDLIEEMVRAGRKRGGDNESFVQASGETLPFTDAVFDLVVSYVSLVDIPDFRAAISESARVLKRGGRLVSANLNFASAGLPPSPWQRDEAGNRLFFRLDNYAEERSMVLEWIGVKIRNWHRPLSAYMKAYLETGLILREYLEPVPEDQSLKRDRRFEDWFRVPIFDVMVWEKP
jgi:SAM-dependent methyltransferase